MRLMMTPSAHYVTPEQLAQALWEASPEEFKAVFLALHERMKSERDVFARLDAIAECMAKARGSDCQQPLRGLLAMIEFHINNERRRDNISWENRLAAWVREGKVRIDEGGAAHVLRRDGSEVLCCHVDTLKEIELAGLR